ncbi:MAG: hypothetical protein JSV53_09900 [candidate division WOR-3 bacterium]|nr:MAG: hypothetical protein JSV53_09900 [candidate division WOR-3 bacterium]
MKHASLLIIIAIFTISPLLAQTTDEAPERTPAPSDAEELKSVSRLPEAAKEAREAGTEEDEIQNVVKGVQEKKLSPEEGANTIRIMEENSAEGASNRGISDFVVEQKAKGVHGEDLGQAVRTELQARHRVRVEEGEGKTERKEEREGQEAEVERESAEKTKSETKAPDEGDQKQKDMKKKPDEEQPASKGKGKGK